MAMVTEIGAAGGPSYGEGATVPGNAPYYAPEQIEGQIVVFSRHQLPSPTSFSLPNFGRGLTVPFPGIGTPVSSINLAEDSKTHCHPPPPSPP